MSSWRDSILNEFVPNVSKLTLVADPDSLMTEEKLTLALHARGFDLIEFHDAVEFRYAYESQYRSIWDRGDHTDLVVILRLQDVALASLPYDLLGAGRKLAFDLGGMFPHLSYPVIEQLDRSLLDALWDAQRRSPPDRMGDKSTTDYILRHVFGIAAELISNEVDLLRVLLRIHYSKINIPHSLADRLAYVLKAHGGFQTWPLDEIILNEVAFFAFLQERWPVFLSTQGSVDQVRDGSHVHRLTYSGPDLLPFGHQDIRVYIDDLFVEGRLTPVGEPEVPIDAGSWVHCGVIQDTADNDDVRMTRLFELIESGVPTVDDRYSDWTAFGLRWAELGALINSYSGADERARFLQIGATLNDTFAQWLSSHYASLINLPPTNPAMLHHVPRRLARELETASEGRVALIVVDGLALEQWVSVRQILQEQDRNLMLRESATFAWIPTLTSVSRQSVFAGKAPLYFPSSIYTTNSEEGLWRQYWEGNGLSRHEIAYQRGLGDGDPIRTIETLLRPGRTKVVGLVVDKVDRIMHGMQLGSAGMHNQVKQWCRNGFLGSIIGYLIDHGYQVWLTSDHGNIECRGKGRPSEGAIAETRGERVRIYPTEELRASVAEEFIFAQQWQPVGLPANCFPLVTKGKDAFVGLGETVVAHGGISIEEVIVPLVKIDRRK